MPFALFLILLIGIPAALVWWSARRLHRSGKKKAAYFLMIGYGSLLLAWIAAEVILYMGKSDVQENPWYFWADSRENSINSEVPFSRKPHIDWQGMAHGDLAVLNGDPDPYAREVHFMTDADGFRNHRPITAAEVVVLGDSYTEAGNINVEDTYVSRLGAATGKTVKNLGMSGYTTPFEVRNLLRFGIPMKPKVAILQVAESNDLTECAVYYDWVKSGRQSWPSDEGAADRADSWKMRSPAYGLYQRIFPLALNDYPLEGFQKDAEGNEYLVRCLRGPGMNMSPAGHLGWEVMRGSLMRFSEECHANGIRPVVILVPDKVNVLRDVIRWKEHSAELLKGNPPIPPQQSLAAYLVQTCKENALQFVDAGPALTAAAKRGELVYLPMDTHLAPAGHKVLADLLLPFIK